MAEKDTRMQKMEVLKKQHRELDKLAADLSQRLYLTQEEKAELARLKKAKLKKKDEIYILASELGMDL